MRSTASPATMGILSRSSPATLTIICPNVWPFSTGASTSGARWSSVATLFTWSFWTRRRQAAGSWGWTWAVPAQPHIDGGQGLTGTDIYQRVVGEAEIEQALGALKAGGGGGGVEDHRNEFHPVPLCRGREAVARGIGGAGLSPVAPS